MPALKTIAAILAVASASQLIGCRHQTSVVAVIPRTTGTLLWEPMHLGAAEIAKSAGLHMYWNAPADEGDTEKQLSFISQTLARGYRGLIFAPDETLASRGLVLQVVNSGRPVVIVDDQLGPPPGPLLSYVTDDEEAGAKLAADRVAGLLHGTGSIAVIGISPRLESGILREESFEKALASVAPNIHIDFRRYGDSVVTHQQQIADEILKRHQHIDVIVALTGIATRGAYFAKIANDDPSRVKIVGFDQDLLLPVQSGDVDSVIIQNTRAIGQVAMRNLDAQLRGETVKGVTLVPPILLTKETIRVAEINSLWEFARYPWREQ
jgi:ribose transport system substrate-binding protein